MRTETQEKLLKFLLKALKPLVHMLLESGIGHREFSQVAKMAFVDVATKNYGIRGRDTNISRVAVMTGLTRKEVKKVRDSLRHDADPIELRPLPASTVIHRWFFDPDFVDDNQQPRVLQFDTGKNSFKDLVRKYAGDIPPGAIRTELKRTGSIKVDPDGRLRAIRRDYKPDLQDDQVLRAFERPLTALLLNLQHNNVVCATGSSKAVGWPERMVEIRNIDIRKLGKVVELVRDKTRMFTEDLDEVLYSFQKKNSVSSDEAAKSPTVGVGVYYFELQ